MHGAALESDSPENENGSTPAGANQERRPGKGDGRPPLESGWQTGPAGVSFLTMANQKFAVGAIVHNRATDEDAKVVSATQSGSGTVYKVKIPMGKTGWELGSTEANWSEADLELSTNELLRLDS
jgi:hypothetical protein